MMYVHYLTSHVWHLIVPHNTTHNPDSPPPTSHPPPPPISATTTTTSVAMAMLREAIIQTGLSLGGYMANLAIGILHADQGSYMLRLPLGFTLAFNCGQ